LRKTFLILLLLFPLITFSQKVITGKVVSITDGDTFKLLTQDSVQIKVRLANIDCPEKKQAYSTKAKEFTSKAIFGKNVTLMTLKKDRYGRTIANVIYNDSLNLIQELLKQGLAWHYLEYSNDPLLQKLEDQAKKEKIGLWHDEAPIPPWKWRNTKKKKTK